MWKIIASIDQNRGIGKNNNLLFNSKEDLRWFRTITQYNTVIMGRSTWDSLPKKPLDWRANIVLSSNPEKITKDFQVTVLDSLESAVNFVSLQLAQSQTFVIGGESLYKETLDLCDAIYLTEFYATSDADKFFPTLSEDWEKAYISQNISEDGLNHRHVIYIRKSISAKSLSFVKEALKYSDNLEWGSCSVFVDKLFE